MATPIKYVPQKKNGTLLWVPVYKKGEGPSAQKVQPVQQPVQQVEEVLSPPSSYFHKKYQSRHKGTIRKGIITEGVCKVCDKPFTYSRSGSVKQICSSFCAYEAQKGYNRAYNKRRSDAKKLELRKKLAEEKAKKKETKTALCKGCGKSFQWKQEGQHAPRKFCSAVCRVEHHLPPANKKTATKKEPPKKTFVERVAEHLPTPTVVESVKDQPAPKAVVPTWEALCSDANELGVDLEAEPKNGQNFYIALLMARRAHHYEEWKRLIKSQDCRIRQYPETYIALKGVSGIGAVAAARALKARMNM